MRALATCTRLGLKRSALVSMLTPVAPGTALLHTLTASRIGPFELEQFKCLSDNYGFIIHEPRSGLTACVDTPEVAPIVAACERRGWALTHIFNTHHHHDHTGGNAELKARFSCKVLGPAAETSKIPTIDQPLSGGDTFDFAGRQIQVIDVGGHTLGHIAYHVPDASAVFVGDSLFALGCGRLFEGSASQAWASLQRLAALPPETAVFCAHEYTETNLRFALAVDPENPALQQRASFIKALRAQGKPTVPSTIGLELETNPFLRPSSPTLRNHLGVPDSESEEQTFARVRKMKDNA
mmetsp:Transcript_45828/g.97777  ORF Transcript_45828/g.97777 Transcript_45828/m.97777 type:complete len:296 (-) Transcript_45828:436-1323(-)